MKKLRFWFMAAVVAAVLPFTHAVTMIYPVSAIEDLWHLPADDFRTKYGGINVSGIGPSDEGWYVRYRHENLTYLFGPLEDRDDARQKMWDLETVRDAAIKNRPALNTSEVDFVRFTFSGVYGKAGDTPFSGAGSARISVDGKSGPDGDMDGDGITNALDDDMDGDGTANGQDGDADGDGIPNGVDDYHFGSDPGPNGTGLASDGKNGPAGDLDGDGTPNDRDGDMDGDGIPNGQDGDSDGDGIPNGTDNIAYGGQPGSDGTGNLLAGGDSDQAGGRDGKGSQAGGGGSAGTGGEAGQAGSQGQQGRQVASNQRGNQRGAQGGQDGGQEGQSGQQGGSSGSSGSQSGQPGGSASPMGGGSEGGGGNPLQVLSALLRMILGI